MDTQRRSLLAGAAAAAGAVLAGPGGRAVAQTASFTPERFGAKGDGVTNDSRAFNLLAKAVNAAGGGTIDLRKTTYVVGAQVPTIRPDSLYYFSPADLLVLTGCTKPVVIRGNGARLKCQDGLRYGIFDTQGRPARHPMPYLGPGVATPYNSMVRAENCSGGVEIADLELDGNIARLSIGGEYGDHGRQIPFNGISLVNNSGPEVIRNVYTHHHGLDGLIVDGIDKAAPTLPKRLISGLRSEFNGRQGASLIGGRGYAFERCKFNHTGRGPVMSAPGAGVDIEAEDGKLNRDYSFTDCEFVDNAGCGMVADSGPSEGAVFTRCTFVGTTAWSAWPFKPRFRFNDCRFVGAVVRTKGDDDRSRACQFTDCTFLDDPKLSPTGKVFVGDRGWGPICDVSNERNVTFRRCTFRLTAKGMLPWSWYAFYEDCRMDQAFKEKAFPKGKYYGHNVLNGAVDLYGTRIAGVLVANGERLENRVIGDITW